MSEPNLVKLDPNFKPKTHYIIERGNDSEEFNKWVDVVSHYLQFDDVHSTLHGWVINRDDFTQLDIMQVNDIMYELMEEALKECGYTVHEVIRGL